jgi:uncharacterized protein YjiS (DUF1127 family)
MTSQSWTVPTRRGHRLDTLVAHGRATLATWQHRRRERRTLRALVRLEEWVLTDLGVNRFAAAQEARRPFWQPLALDGVYGKGPHAWQTPSPPVYPVAERSGLNPAPRDADT